MLSCTALLHDSVFHKHFPVIQFHMESTFIPLKIEGKYGPLQKEPKFQNLASNSLSLSDLSPWISPGCNHASKAPAHYSYFCTITYISNTYPWHVSLQFSKKPHLIMNSLIQWSSLSLEFSSKDTNLDLELVTWLFTSTGTLTLSVHLSEAWFLIKLE